MSNLKTVCHSPDLEQYALPGSLAAEILITAYYFGDIHQKDVADLGCGSGILGIGALLLQANSVLFVDCDCDILRTARENCAEATKGLKAGRATFHCSNIQDIVTRVDTVVENPPFGTRRRGEDVQFLKKATEIASVVYSLHKKGNAAFLEKQTEHMLTHIREMRFPLFRSYPFHERRVVEIEVELLRFEEVRT